MNFSLSVEASLNYRKNTAEDAARIQQGTYMNSCLGDGIMVYKYIDIVGTSNTVITDAINNAIEEASKTVKNIKWGELGRVTFRVEEGKKIEYQAEVRIGFEVIRNNEN
jgi:flavin-binding protein dodecin